MTSTRDILDRHLKAFGECDIKGVLSDYGKDIVFFTANGPLKGVEAVRSMFETLIAEFRKPGASFTMERYFVQGEHGYILWNAETADNVYEMATDTFVVQDGKIVAQSYTARIRPKR
ncbi:MAG: nuclear transport factor 2 family protein [Gammaproteobacteria bacterium]|nr:nuclear transport factor 2 family protein [Gammaproteobacteria bacterium]